MSDPLGSASFDVDVIVVGAGPIGLIAACALGHHSVKTRVFEERIQPKPHSRANDTSGRGGWNCCTASACAMRWPRRATVSRGRPHFWTAPRWDSPVSVDSDSAYARGVHRCPKLVQLTRRSSGNRSSTWFALVVIPPTSLASSNRPARPSETGLPRPIDGKVAARRSLPSPTMSWLPPSATNPFASGARTSSCAWSATFSLERQPGSQGRPAPYRRALRIMSANQALFPCRSWRACSALSKAGFYAWRDRPASARSRADDALLERVRTFHDAPLCIYGVPRIHAELTLQGQRHGRKRIAKLMRAAGLAGACHRKGGPVTTRHDQQAAPALDLVDRNFKADAPDQLWVADITYAYLLANRAVARCPRRD